MKKEEAVNLVKVVAVVDFQMDQMKVAGLKMIGRCMDQILLVEVAVVVIDHCCCLFSLSFFFFCDLLLLVDLVEKCQC